jgi:hypothetical protein
VSTPLTTLELSTAEVALRRATLEHLPAIVELLASDPVGSTREVSAPETDLEPYQRAFRAIDYERLGFVASHEGLKLQL